MTPALSLDDNHMSRLSRAGVLLAGLRWRPLTDVYRTCGSLMRVQTGEAARWREALAKLQYPDSWARWCESDETAAHCGLPLSEGGIWLGAGAMVRPARLIAGLLAQGAIQRQARRVATLTRTRDGWAAYDEQRQSLGQAAYLVLATAGRTPMLLQSAMPEARCPKLTRMQNMSGQVAYFRTEGLPPTSSIVAGAGYWLPADEGIHVGGSTYDFDDEQSAVSQSGFEAIVKKWRI